MANFRHILVPTDFEPASAAALTCARDIAARFGARLSLLHVITDPKATGLWTPDVYVPASPETRQAFLRGSRQRLESALPVADRERFHVTLEARIGAAAEAIVDYARENGVDLIVMGTHGRRGVVHLMLGSVAELVVRYASCPVLTTHGAPVPILEEVAGEPVSCRV
jgi:nucleotide-binding universal stress UspA family protein